MKQYLLRCLFVCATLLPGASAWSAGNFSFAFIAHPFGDALSGEATLNESIAATDKDNLAFVVVAGIKSDVEPCSDSIYESRRTLLDSAKNGIIVTLTASDWSDCRYRNGRSAAMERLNRVRELFFADEFSFGATRLPLIRQSANPKFRDYAEHARWEIGGIMFATLNLPSNNNRYLVAAGRNNEFEDRLVASRDWLQRLVVYAKRSKLQGIVIFCDGNPFSTTNARNRRRDGYAEIRQQFVDLAAQFPGKILLVHNRHDLMSNGAAPDGIRWTGNLGQLGVASGWARLSVAPADPMLFRLSTPNATITARKN